MHKGALFFESSPAFIVCRFFNDDHSDQCEVIYLIIVLICITIKLLEENISSSVFDIHHSKSLFEPPPGVMEIKTKAKWKYTDGI